jgi:hypothetical protein
MALRNSDDGQLLEGVLHHRLLVGFIFGRGVGVGSPPRLATPRSGSP